MTIVHVIARLNVGGAALHVLQLAREQRRRGHDVVVVAGTLAAGEESMEYVADELGVSRPSASDPAARALRACRRRGDQGAARPDPRAGAPTSSTRTPRKPGRRAGSRPCSRARARPRAVVHTYHGHVLSGYFTPRRSGSSGSSSGCSPASTDALVAVSDEVRDDLVALGVAPANRFVVVPYGFDLPEWSAADDEAGAAFEPSWASKTRRSSSAGPAG